MPYVQKSSLSLKGKWQRNRKVKKRLKLKPLPYSINPPEVINSIKVLVKDSWDEIHETGNVLLLSKTKQKESYRFLKYCSDTWDEIRDQYIQKFKMSTDYKLYLSVKSEVADLLINHALTQDNWDLMLLNMAKKELKQLTPAKHYDPIEEAELLAIALKKNTIDTSITTVDRYYTLLGINNKMVANA